MSRGVGEVPPERWAALSRRKIYFGHHSVGANILAGVADLMAGCPSFSLTIVETGDSRDFSRPLFAHSKVGRNEDPRSKTEEFAALIDGGIGEAADIAFFKFCYVDFRRDTDAGKVFDDYRLTLARLKESWPGTTFVHVTVPLRTVQRGPRAWVKKGAGLAVGGYADNMKRNEFNEMIRREYGRKAPLFDLARIESTSPTGRRETFVSGGRRGEALFPGYTGDGGHLNEGGRRAVAGSMLDFLAGLP